MGNGPRVTNDGNYRSSRLESGLAKTACQAALHDDPAMARSSGKGAAVFAAARSPATTGKRPSARIEALAFETLLLQRIKFAHIEKQDHCSGYSRER